MNSMPFNLQFKEIKSQTVYPFKMNSLAIKRITFLVSAHFDEFFSIPS